MAEITEAQVVVKGEFDGQKLVAGLNAVSKLGKKAAKDSDLLNMAMGKISDTATLLGGDLKNAVGLITKGFDSLNQKIDAQTSKINKLNSALKGTVNSYKNVDKTLQSAEKLLGDNSRGAAQANRFNSANFLAQFQDIAVTSAMGMNPLLIAVQQGTQLQYILAQSKAPLKDFISGLKSAFSAAGLLTIGLTGLVAAGIQLVNWASVGRTILNGLGSAFVWIGDKIGALNLTGIGEHFKSLADDIKDAEEAAKGFNKILKDFDVYSKKLEEKRFELSLEGKTDIEKVKARADRELSEIANKTLLEGKDMLSVEELEGVQQQIKILSDETVRLAQIEIENKNKAKEAAEAKKKEKEALNEAAKAARKDADEVQRLAEAWDRVNMSVQNKIDDLLMQKSLIGAGTYETTYNRTLSDLTRQAEGAGIELTPEKTAELKDYAENTARLSELVERLTARYDLAKSSVKSLFSEMRQGLKEGESAWEAFGNAALSVLDKLIDKALDFGVDMLFMAGRSYFGGSTLGTNSSAMPMLGGEYAKGGVFSNGVYDSPTVFKFAKGGKFGVMGEAGPEAVMPLTRGPDGSLGVRAENTGNSSPVVVNVINNSTAQARVEQRQTSQGVELDVIIDQLVAEKMNKPGTSSNTALRAFSNQKLIAR